jgi:hypothetical protein
VAFLVITDVLIVENVVLVVFTSDGERVSSDLSSHGVTLGELEND